MNLNDLVDKEVLVEMNNIGIKRIGTLDSYSENGIIIKNKDNVYFIPWRSIMYIRPSKSGDQEYAGNAGKRSSVDKGFVGTSFFTISLIALGILITFMIYSSLSRERIIGITDTIISLIAGPMILIGFFGTFVSFLLIKAKTAILMVSILLTGSILFIIYFVGI